jgi:hypothetical protein
MKALLLRWTCLLPVVAVLASCGGSSGSPGGPSTLPSSVAITGLPEAVWVNATTTLKAQVFQGATVKDCAATWSVDDAKVATISPAGVLSTTNTSGYVTVTATCDGVAAQAQARVQRTTPLNLVVYAYDDAVKDRSQWHIFTLDATVEFLDGPYAGKTWRTWDTAFGYGVGDVTLPAKVRVTANGFAARDAVLSDETVPAAGDLSTSLDWWLPMKFAPDANTDTLAGELTEQSAGLAFTLAAPGAVQVRTWWTGMDSSSIDRATLALSCNGSVVETLEQGQHSQGSGFTKDVGTSGPCTVSLTSRSPREPWFYRIAVTYPKK